MKACNESISTAFLFLGAISYFICCQLFTMMPAWAIKWW